ncbi:AI-2E family transporter [Neiella marina]|uniref:AI-2E family transporter n=1 Tax=Neiella holothuriorum TaxID=2870530 RepID=A0ABS7ECH8_9GAMM|nr:AI-2E family transporter [Neiella holothuriorum]MBW8190029.1 AI-2E family transporter [Neiella holothuriorum]
MTPTPLKNPRNWLLVGLLIAAVYACYRLILPYIEPIVLALIFGILMAPIHHWLLKRLGNRANITAIISCILLTLVILLPAFTVIVAIVRQGINYTIDLRSWIEQGGLETLLAHPWVQTIKLRLELILPDGFLALENLRQQAIGLASNAGKGFVGVSTGVLGSLSHFLMQLTLMLFALFFVLRDYDRMVEFFRHALPLSRSQEDALIDEIEAVSKSALLGTLLTAMTQGFVGGFAMWLAGFPGLFWGTMMAFASLIPVVGTALIWLPAAIFLLITGDQGWGIFLIVWGVVVVGSIDNFVRPLFMQGAGSLNTVVIFFSLLGGLHMFGLMGLLYGPLIVALTLVLFHLYETEFHDFLAQQDKS